MGSRYRKSFGSGPVRINVSKSGVGWSVGTKGARITKKTNGGYRTTASIPGTGISYVKDSGQKQKKTGTAVAPSSSLKKTSTAVAPSSSFWKVFFACVCFAIAIACGLSPDGVAELTAFMFALGVLLVVLAFVPARTRKKENRIEEIRHKLRSMPDNELLEYKKLLVEYIQGESGEISTETHELLEEINKEEEYRALKK